MPVSRYSRYQTLVPVSPCPAARCGPAAAKCEGRETETQAEEAGAASQLLLHGRQGEQQQDQIRYYLTAFINFYDNYVNLSFQLCKVFVTKIFQIAKIFSWKSVSRED